MKDLEHRMGDMEKTVKSLEGSTQKHSLGWQKQQTVVKARVAALEKALGELPPPVLAPTTTADMAADMSQLKGDVSELKESVTELFFQFASIPAPPSTVVAPLFIEENGVADPPDIVTPPPSVVAAPIVPPVTLPPPPPRARSVPGEVRAPPTTPVAAHVAPQVDATHGWVPARARRAIK